VPKLPAAEAKALIARRHPEWAEFEQTWRWLQDSLEGGERYRLADYRDKYTAGPKRNLIRHQRETPPPLTGNQLASADGTTVKALENAAESTYDLRLARTPVPGFVAEVVEKWLSRIFRREIKRDGPPAVEEWWADVDGTGATIDEWMADTVAPLLVTLGQLDILCDHPAAPKGEPIASQADVLRLKLGTVRARFVLPENMLWWRLDEDGSYVECLVQEYYDGENGETLRRYRHWTPVDSACYDPQGELLEPVVPHRYGRPPIRRVFDRRKFRCCHTGHSRIEGIAERQREYYNSDSDLILCGVMTASPPLSGPVDYLTNTNEVVVGPGFILPKYASGGNYEGWEYVSHDHAGDESIRANLDRRRDDVDREAGLTKPAGVNGSGQTARQSGVSKQLDSEDGNNLLAKLAKSLAKAEREIADLVWLVANEGRITPTADLIRVVYPTGFNLYGADEQLKLIGQYQDLKAGAGGTPLADAAMLKRAVRIALDGLDDEEFRPLDDEIDRFLESRTEAADLAAEAATAPTPVENAMDGEEPATIDDGLDPAAE